MQGRLVQIMAGDMQEMLLHITDPDIKDEEIKSLYIEYINSDIEDFEEFYKARGWKNVERVYTEEIYI